MLDADGLRRIYQAWCRSVPFDNVRKLIVLHGDPGAPLPGMDAEEFFTAWLQHGCGGTCWPSATALHALLAAVGFDPRLVAASMGDAGVPMHGTERYEISREMSPFNNHVGTRRNDASGVVSVGGGKRYRRSASGVELHRALVEELGMSEEIVGQLAGVLS